MKVIWVIIGLLSLGLGIIGAFLPLIPTVPLLLLAAYSFSRSSDRLHCWLLRHRIFGPPILAWREGGIISRRAKFMAGGSILASFGLSYWLAVSPTFLIIQVLLLIPVSVFILSRPGHLPSKSDINHPVDPKNHSEP